MTDYYAVQGDNKKRLSTTLINGAERSAGPLDLSNATAVEWHAWGPTSGSLPAITKTSASGAVTFLTDPTGSVTVQLVTADLATPGDYYAEWQVTYSDGTVVTVPTEQPDGFHIRAQGA